MKKYKCEICGYTSTSFEGLMDHIEEEHDAQIPQDFTAAQYNFSLRNNRWHGDCMICKRPTSWNPTSLRYNTLCTRPECKQKYIEIRNERMIGKYGKTTLLNDAVHQRKMLAGRSISGTYPWSDGKQIGYVGTYELDFLKYLDNFMNFESNDVISPSPNTYYYEYEGETKFYIPDYFIVSLNAEIEIKTGGDNPNNHHKIVAVDKEKEKLKDQVLLSQKNVNYIKITNKDYSPFFEFLLRRKEQYANGVGEVKEKPIFVLGK